MGSPASMEETVPPGYRFHPTDEELVGYYLKHKLMGDDSKVQKTIAEVDVCKIEPWDLPAFSKVISDDPEWFFFSPRGLKYKNSNRSKRATKAGYWKATGKDRNIKTRGTNNVIGTKKTLVFYKGRVPHGVKTSWVIHEYHAVTFPADQRSFVLCRLMEKAEKKAEGGTDALNHGEVEPRSHVAADSENQATVEENPDVDSSPEVNWGSIFLAAPQAEEYDFPSLQQSPIVSDQEPYFQESTFPSTCSWNENTIKQFLFETTEEEDNIDLSMDSILVDEDVFINQERRHAFINDSTPSQPLRRVYHESSETDAELLPAQYGNILDTTSSACNEHADSRKYQVMSTVKSSDDAVYTGHPPLSSKNEVNQAKNNSIFDDGSLVVNTCGDSTAIMPSVCVIRRDSSPSPPRASSPSTSKMNKTNYQIGSHIRVTEGCCTISDPKEGFKPTNIQQEAQKETHILESTRIREKLRVPIQERTWKPHAIKHLVPMERVL